MRADALDAWCRCAKARRWPRRWRQKKRFPGLLAMFARLGEQTGQLPLMLQRAAASSGRGAAPRHGSWPPSWSRC
jgi:general secretion pathway protein F